jgi:hypothetical protein
MAKVKIKIPTIEARIKQLKNMDNIVFKVATRLKLLLMQNWSRGAGADDKKMAPLKEPYKTKKAASGRTAIRNLLFSGNMLQDLDPVQKQDFVWILKFKSGRERKKAQGNSRYASNMMTPVSDKINQKLQKLAFKLFTKD